MNTYGDRSSFDKADQFLMKNDPEVIPLVSSFELELRSLEVDYFCSLIRSIIFQQLNSKVAHVIFDRFVRLFPNNRFPIPQDVVDMESDQMRSAGISNSKVNYIKNIAEAFLNNSIEPSIIPFFIKLILSISSFIFDLTSTPKVLFLLINIP